MGGGDPYQTFAGVLQQLKADPKNQGIDDATLFEAAKNVTAVTNPEMKMMMQFYEKMSAIEERLYATDKGAGTKITIAGMQSSDKRRGQDMTMAEKAADRNERAWATKYTRDTIARAKNVATQVKDQYQTLAEQRRTIMDQVAILKAQYGGMAPKQMLDPLAAQLTQANDALHKFWMSNPGLPKPSEIVNEPEMPDSFAAPEDAGAKGRDTTFDADEKAAQTQTPAAQSTNGKVKWTNGAPTATDAKGNKVKWDGKKWVPVQKAQ